MLCRLQKQHTTVILYRLQQLHTNTVQTATTAYEYCVSSLRHLFCHKIYYLFLFTVLLIYPHIVVVRIVLVCGLQQQHYILIRGL